VTTPAAFAGALAALPGMGPATLVRLLTADAPAGAWDRVCSGEVRRPDGRAARPRPGSVATASVSPALPWDDTGPEGPGDPRDPDGAEPDPGDWRHLERRGPGAASVGSASGTPGAGRGRLSWADAARRSDPDQIAEEARLRGIEVTWWGAETYPEVLRTDPQPPGVLFWRGDLTWLDRPCVALVGTRRATPDGRTTAFQLGRDLAAAGICVVSGLALGIDGAAHSGALSVHGAGTVGVAASGVDVAYPARHAELWERVVGHGAVCSETPPGRPAQAWRFPARNRVIAGLSRMVVVVESHASGGSLITAEAAMARGIDVAAVPGPVRSPASEGSNQLLADGPAPVRHAGDILDALGSVTPWPPPGFHQRPRRLAPGPKPTPTPGAGAGPTPGPGPTPTPTPGPTPRPLRSDAVPVRPGSTGPPSSAGGPGESGEPGEAAEGRLSPVALQVLEAVPWRQATLNQIVEQCGRPVGAVAAALDDLEAAGLVTLTGSWWCRVGVP
jgi:DNA processing protein